MNPVLIFITLRKEYSRDYEPCNSTVRLIQSSQGKTLLPNIVMKTQDKITYWLDIALYDLETAELLNKNGRYLYAAFMCQQALEKILKALYIRRFSKEAPYSHNLTYLMSLIELDLHKRHITLLSDLTAYYIEGRYPSYKATLSTIVDKKRSAAIVKSSRELFECLLKKLK